MLLRLHAGMVRRAAPLILGKHPHNTPFSFNYFTIRHLRQFMRAAALRAPAPVRTVVDVGGGACPFYSCFAGRISRYICVDVDDGARAARPPAIDFVQGTAEELPLADGEADIIICNQVLEHVIDAEGSVREILRVLAPGGLFIGSMPHISTLHLEPFDFRRFTTLGIEKLLRDIGFEIMSMEPNGSVYSTIAYLLAMDWMLGKYRPGQPQQFSSARAIWLSPLVFLMNMGAWLAERLLPDSGRSPANICWVARKPASSSAAISEAA